MNNWSKPDQAKKISFVQKNFKNFFQLFLLKFKEKKSLSQDERASNMQNPSRASLSRFAEFPSSTFNL